MVEFRLFLTKNTGEEKQYYLAGKLEYYTRESMGIQTHLPGMANYEEVIDMLNQLMDVLREIVDKWERD